MRLTARAARLVDLACSAVKAGTESSAIVVGATGLAAGTSVLASPLFVPAIATVALGLAGRKVYKEYKASKAEEQVEQSLTKLLEEHSSIQAALKRGFGTLELGQIDGSIDHDQLKADLQKGLEKLTELAAMQRSDRLALAEQNNALVESLNGFEQRFDEIDQKLDKLLELLTHRPHFAVKPPPGEKDAFASLRFTNSKSTLVGREDELKKLDAFLDHTPAGRSDFSFWLVTGPGGMGKSRLAHELCLRRQEQYWDVGFWEPNAGDNWIEWQPIAPTLIVFDYLLGRTDEIADAIRYMAGRTLDHPVRFMVLEREAQGAWWEKVGSRDGGAARPALDGYQYQGSLELQGFLDDASARAFFERSLPEDEHDQVDAFIGVFRETDEDGRPIYAKAIIEAAEEFGLEKAATFSKAALMLYILRKEHDRAAEMFRDNTALFNGLMNLLTITTLARGVSLDKFDPWADDGLRDIVPEKNAFEKEDFRAISSSSGEHDLPGLEPDLLGEMFVLQQLARMKTGADRRHAVRAAWHAKPDDTALMSYMMIADFRDSAWIGDVQELGVRNDINSKQELSDLISALLTPAAVLIGQIAYLNGKLGQCAAVLSHTISSVDSPAEHRARALNNRGVIHRQFGRSNEAITDYTRAIKLEDAPAAQIARALNNRGIEHGTRGLHEDAIADFSRAIELKDSPSAEVARALNNRGVAHVKLRRPYEAIADYTHVIKLNGVPADQVAEALYNRGATYGQLGQLDDEIKDYTHAIELKDAPAGQVAKALVNRGVAYNELGRRDDEIKDYTLAIQLKDAPAEQVARASFNRGVSYTQFGRVSDAVLDLGDALSRPGLPEDMRAEAIRLLKAVYSHDGDEVHDAIKQAAGRVLRDAGVDPEEEGTGDRPPGTGG
ncbi:MAG: AAA family ATPase [Planctomycetota bacterium]